LYHASWPCVAAHACSGNANPANDYRVQHTWQFVLPITKPYFPFLNSGKQTVALARPGLSVIPFLSFINCFNWLLQIPVPFNSIPGEIKMGIDYEHKLFIVLGL
jgi:hypothetical protein